MGPPPGPKRSVTIDEFLNEESLKSHILTSRRHTTHLHITRLDSSWHVTVTVYARFMILTKGATRENFELHR